MILSAMKIRFILPAIFHELANDAIELIIEFILSMEKYILNNVSITRKAKASFFGGFFLDQMATIYKDRYHESDELLLILDRFLTNLCCSLTCGIVYSNPDWFIGCSKESLSKIRNKPLLRFISSLKPTSNENHQKLTLNILKVAPDIIEIFLKQISLSYEPRFSTKWFENISFLSKIISLPPPPFQPLFDSFHGLHLISSNSQSSKVDILPTNTDILVNNIFPSVLSRSILTQGLQHDNKTVKYQTLTITIIIIEKLNQTINKLREEIKFSSKQKKKWKEYIDHILQDLKKLLPDIQVIIGLHQQISTDFIEKKPTDDNIDDSDVSIELLYEKTLCLLKFYHLCFPGILSGANFDILKLISVNFNTLPYSIQINIISLLNNPTLKWTTKGKFYFSF